MRQLSFLSILALIFTGCVGQSGYNYSQSSYQQVQTMMYGLVTEVRQVEIGDSGVGTGLGAVLGGIAGHQVGGGRGKDLATVGGVLLGGLAGNQMNKDTGQELVIKLDNGSYITTVNKIDPNRPMIYRAMDRVRVILNGNQIRRVELVR